MRIEWVAFSTIICTPGAARQKDMRKTIQRFWAVVFGAGVFAAAIGAQTAPTRKSAGIQERQSALSKKQAAKFSARADALLGAGPAGKGEWGLLIVDAESGEKLYEQNADRYFVPASNMKLFTSALALAKLGPDYRFHTTLETGGAVSNGVLTGDLALVGRGDPN